MRTLVICKEFTQMNHKSLKRRRVKIRNNYPRISTSRHPPWPRRNLVKRMIILKFKIYKMKTLSQRCPRVKSKRRSKADKTKA